MGWLHTPQELGISLPIVIKPLKPGSSLLNSVSFCHTVGILGCIQPSTGSPIITGASDKVLDPVAAELVLKEPSTLKGGLLGGSGWLKFVVNTSLLYHPPNLVP